MAKNLAKVENLEEVTTVTNVELSKAEYPNGIGVLALATAIGITASNGEARRLIAQGGLSLDDNKIEDANMVVPADKTVIVKKGKKVHLKVVFK